MHYAEFAADEVHDGSVRDLTLGELTVRQSQTLLNAIKEYDANKWKVIGQKVGKPAKVSPVSEAAWCLMFSLDWLW